MNTQIFTEILKSWFIETSFPYNSEDDPHYTDSQKSDLDARDIHLYTNIRDRASHTHTSYIKRLVYAETGSRYTKLEQLYKQYIYSPIQSVKDHLIIMCL